MILTSSELSSWQHCHRCWWITYYRQLRAIREDRSVLRTGTLYHRGLEAYYRGAEHPLDWVKRKSLKLIEENEGLADKIAEEAHLAGIMLDGYMQWLEETGADADLEFYATEAALEVALGDSGFTLRGKLDARARHRSNGARVFVEHKSVQSLKDLPKTAQTNPQFLNYELLEFEDLRANGAEGERADGTLLNMGRKVKRTARAKPPFYGRHEVHHSLEELRSHWRHIVTVGREIEAARARLDAGESHHFVVPPSPGSSSTWRHHEICWSGMFDDGSDIEGYLAAMYEQHDPMSRYDDDEGDDE